jgi:opacity protein-like surface antigen
MRIIFSLLLIFSCSAFAQYNWRVSVSAGGISPEFLVKKPFGSQFEGSIYYTFSETQAGISSGFNKWEVTYGPGGNSFRAIPILAGVRVLIPQDLFTLYFSGELGVNIIEREYTYEEYIPSERFPGLWSLNFSERREETVTKFAYRLGVGATFTFLNNFETDISLRYNNINYVFITSYVPPERSNIGLTYYSFVIGLSYNF